MNISNDSRKIAISFMIVLGLSMAMMIFVLSRMSIMQDKLDIITKEHNLKSSLMVTFRHGVYARQITLRNIVLTKDVFERDEGKSHFNNYALEILKARESFLKLPLNEKEKKLITKISASMEMAYRAQHKLIDMAIEDAEYQFTTEDINTTFRTQQIVLDMVNKMILMQKNATLKSVMDAESSYQTAKTSTYFLGSISLIFGIFVALYIIRLTESQARHVSSAMARLEQSHDMLEKRVIERTEELVEARDDALASNKAKDSFLATMSHELRTPLNIIIGYSEILEEQAEDENMNSFIPDLKKIQSAANHQLKLVSNILDISRIEAGKLEISPIEFDIRMLVSNIYDTTQPLVEKNNNVLEVHCADKIGLMYSDNIRIHQILLNLLSNAAKFTHEGLIQFTVCKSENGEEVTFEVKDTGVGISYDYMKDLFSKFTQADSSTTRKYGGSGLGLSISKQLSQQLMGDITATSEEGNGSCFTLILPTNYQA